MLYKKIDLMEGLDERGNGAFNAEALAEYDADNMQVVQYLAKSLSPIASLIGAYLNEGAGFGVVFDGDEVSIIGLEPVDSE